MRLRMKGASARLRSTPAVQTIADLPMGQRCILDHLELPEDIARRLMELGFLPGNEVVPARRAPGGGPVSFVLTDLKSHFGMRLLRGFTSAAIPNQISSYLHEPLT